MREVEPAVDKGVPLVGHVGGKHPNLTIGDLTLRARVLARNATRGLALLEEARLVENQHGIRLTEGLNHIVTHHIAQSVCVPPAPIEERLLAPGTWITRPFRPHPARLAPLRPEQSVQ